MHERWLQQYIMAHYQGLGFSQLKGPFNQGVDFNGIHNGKKVKVEAEWQYANYYFHQHPPKWADILIVATLEPPPAKYLSILPSRIINVDLQQVIEWAQPRADEKEREDFKLYPWRRLSRSLLDLYAYYLKQQGREKELSFIGSHLALVKNKAQKPAGFQFDANGLELEFQGSPEDKFAWDYWLNIAHAVSENYRLKPAMHHPTWIDLLGYELINKGEVDLPDLGELKPIINFIESLLSEGGGHAE